MGIFMAHQVGGVEGAMAAWESLKRLRPDLAKDINKQPKLIHADELKNLVQPAYIVGDYPLYNDGFNVLFGKSGTGKSFVALDIAGRVAVENTVVYIAGEGVHGYGERWEAWKSFHQCQHAELYFWTEALQIIEERDVWEFFQELQDNGKSPKLVIIDTLARSAVGVDENSALAMGQFIAAVDNIRDKLNCSTLVVHHTGNNGNIRGSTSLYGAADSVLALSKYEGLMRLSNKSEYGGKNKYKAESFDQYYTLTPHSAGGFDGAVIVPAERIEADDENSLPEKHRAILEALLEATNGLTLKAVVETTGIAQTTVHRTLKDLKGSYAYVNLHNSLYTITDLGKDALAGGE